jgi:transposase
MGRPRRPLDTVADARKVRTRLKEKGLPGWQRQRLSAVQLGLENSLSLHEIACEIGVSPRTVGEWFDRFREGGIDRVLDRKEKGKGPASWLDARTMRELQVQIARARWRRAEDVRQWLETRLERKLSLVVVYKYLGKIAERKNGVLTPRQNGSGPKRS